MAFLDDLSQVMIQRNQAEAKKQKAMTEISNLNSAIAHEEQMIADTFRQLGVEYFNKNKDLPDAPFYGLISAIKSARQRMDEHRKQIEQIKAIVKCKACGADVATGFGFTHCNNCGTSLNTPETMPAGNYIRCFACGQPLSQDSKFCTGCGKPMAEIIQYYANVTGSVAQAPSAPAPVPPSSPEPVPPAAPIPAASPAPVPPITPNPAVAPPPAPIEAPVTGIKSSCPACGSFVTDEMVFCVGCGAKLK